MKKLLAAMLAVILLTLCGCGGSRSDIPKGYTDAVEHYQKGGFQDYTDYAYYRYPSDELFRNDAAYRLVSDGDIEEIRGYFTNFQGWMSTLDRLDEYDFDDACITPGDYVRIITKHEFDLPEDAKQLYGKYDNYTVLFFDAETLTLYYIHNNI